MPIQVLVVDDSSFFRRRITEIINSDKEFNVVGQASNGQEAIDQALKLNPDIITMDYEMPFLDGISAVREIMKKQPTAILMFSSLTYDGARTTLDALEAGAKDFLPKSFESVSGTVSSASNELLSRLRAIAKASSRTHLGAKPPAVDTSARRPSPTTPSDSPRTTPRSSSSSSTPTSSSSASLGGVRTAPTPQKRAMNKRISIRPRICVIGSSTGGPMALQSVLKCLPANAQMPVLIAQHMPASFTEAFADRLNGMCNVRVCHAKNGEKLKPGHVYIAPGGLQTIIKDSSMTLSILKGDERLNYKPCVDVTFASAAKAFPGKVLAIVLTGMGADGADGARLLKQSNSEVWIQDEESCVVFGMPAAVMKTGFYDDMMSIDRVGPRLSEVVSSGCT